MVIALSQIGEDLIANMANKNPGKFIRALGLSNELVDWHHVQSARPFAYPHRKLVSTPDVAFDGQHQVDVVLWVKPHSAVALELKLGRTRLNREAFNKRFLQNCGRSHGGSRITGNMIAILDRRPACVPENEELYVELGNQRSVQLAPIWGLIVQQSVLDNWNITLAPALSEHVLLTSIQKLVRDYGGAQEFNDLVKELLNVDYFDLWQLGMVKPDVMPASYSERSHLPL